ncbi:SPI-2 type III secretion system export apparatus protein SsaR [Salmonella enterica subsp. enterica serovar Derby]|nr:SPI-2 type III secretion system export apparatus protein SsaR [Salmonella enterica subsp. enterica serovar Derby]EEB9801515.1 SPI-2 type III secretion system export apparatus protein SsaR [Salmonella enterica]EEH5972124.1 SPI-2 type III secretion system export apparatus protein SsaR [Salmonella enterica subsp. enterica serovar Typhimurium]
MSLPDSPLQLIGILFLLSILPLIIVMGTSFLKLAVVFSILRNALGIQQVPPNIALYGLALVLSLFIMGPTLLAVKERWHPVQVAGAPFWTSEWDSKALAPYRQFLQKNSEEKEANYFRNLIKRTWPEDIKRKIKPDSLLILIPAFTVSQLTQAFRIGLLIYLPFLAIDLLISNILLAMGMMMVSPITISLPFKLLIFLLAGGWDLTLAQLVQSFS